MTSDATIEKPKWFTPSAWVLFVWNLLGLMALMMQIMMTPEHLGLIL